MRALARCLAIDLVTVEVVAAFEDAGVFPVVLKGPVLTRWLYRDGAARRYGDSDLLVSPGQSKRARSVLAALGFEKFVEPRDAYTAAMAPQHAECWRRDGQIVDLHGSVFGARAGRQRVWAALTRELEPMELAGVEVAVPGAAANALMVALHAAANGRAGTRSLADLDRALSIADLATWAAAAELGREIDAVEALAAGLRLSRRGGELAERLSLDPPGSVDVLLRARAAPDGSLFLDRLATTDGSRAKLELFARALVPGAEYMRELYPIARTGPGGLAAAYAVRASRRLATFAPALIAIGTARREAREHAHIGS